MKQSKKKKEEGRQAAAGTGSEDDASGGHESNQQSVPTGDARAQSIHTPYTHTHTWQSEAWLSRHVAVCLHACKCVFASVIRRLKMETEDVGPSLSLCLY